MPRTLICAGHAFTPQPWTNFFQVVIAYHVDMADTTSIDAYPVTIRGPLTTNSSGVVTFARVFTHEGRLYVAESADKGKTIRAVSSYPIAEDAVIVSRGRKTASFNGFKWSGCGCSSQWNRHTPASLAALDQTPAETVETGA